MSAQPAAQHLRPPRRRQGHRRRPREQPRPSLRLRRQLHRAVSAPPRCRLRGGLRRQQRYGADRGAGLALRGDDAGRARGLGPAGQDRTPGPFPDLRSASFVEHAFLPQPGIVRVRSRTSATASRCTPPRLWTRRWSSSATQCQATPPTLSPTSTASAPTPSGTSVSPPSPTLPAGCSSAQQLTRPSCAIPRDLPFGHGCCCYEYTKADPEHRLLGPSDAAEVSFVEIGQHQLPFAREMMSLRKWKRVKN